jgi:PPOX class probable F420-dependent enzyme
VTIGAMNVMTRAEARAFLLASPRTAKIATVRSDGRPHVAPVWFDLDGDDIIFTTWHSTVKARDLRRDPRISLCVDDERPPFSFVTIDGTARLSDDLEEVRAWATRIAGRYMGVMRAKAFGARNGVPGELLVRVTPTHVVAQARITDA